MALLPWELNQAVYPRTVSVWRVQNPTAVGAIGYQGEISPGQATATNEVQILSGLPAMIEIYSRAASTTDSGVPSAAYRRTGWYVYIPSQPIGTITERDILKDDLGKRYVVDGAEWSPLGYRLAVTILEA